MMVKLMLLFSLLNKQKNVFWAIASKRETEYETKYEKSYLHSLDKQFIFAQFF